MQFIGLAAEEVPRLRTYLFNGPLAELPSSCLSRHLAFEAAVKMRLENINSHLARENDRLPADEYRPIQITSGLIYNPRLTALASDVDSALRLN